jgi:hypothetical protein
MKLLQCGDIEAQLARTYPPSYLEWKASKKCASLALEVNYSDSNLLNFDQLSKLTFGLAKIN